MLFLLSLVPPPYCPIVTDTHKDPVCVCVGVWVVVGECSVVHHNNYLCVQESSKEIDEQNGTNLYSLRSILIEADLSHYSGAATMS